MFPARKSTGHRRRRGPLAAVVALGAGAAGVLSMSPAHAGAVQPPVFHAAAHPQAPAPAALKARIAGAVKADHGRARAELAAPTTTSGTGSKAGPKIIGGTTTTISAAPWMAQLWYYDDNGTPDDETDDTGFFCGGTVVSPSKILTAAHCVQGYDWQQYGVIVTGTDQLPTTDANGDADLHGGTVTNVWRQWNNPLYTTAGYDNDVAVLTLDGTVDAQPLPLAAADDTASYTVGTAATVYGWGRTSSTSDDLAQTLKEASLPIAADSACGAVFGGPYVAGHMVCAGTPATGSDDGTTSACNGDSGGPLVVNGRIVGVVSWGADGCVAAGSYSVFSRVSAFAGGIDPRLDDTNITGDDKADLFAVAASDGEGYVYASQGSSFAPREDADSFAGLNLVRQADLDRDDYQDLLVRTTGGQLYTLPGTGDSEVLVGGGWNSMKSIVVPGDLNGDGKPDLVGTDTGGTSWLYPGNGAGTFGARTSIGTGWDIYSGVVYGKGDLTGDGRPDLVARDSSGTLWLYKGTGKGSAVWAARTKIGAGWNIYNAFAAVGDVNGDGHADLLARDTTGTLWLYKGTGSATAPYATRVQIGPGWTGYSLFG
ncbi:trypsin-like serine protease [Streptomyces sp. NPDC049040]|uniref:trypsin-like serine protease n=1 Tax=Streptomyces sp. NPDC049040 TaxID=3365593 RepID=UPI0037238C13